MLDLLTLSTSRVRTKRAASCPEHARSRSPSMQASTADMELAFENLDDALEAGFDIVDIREPQELREWPTPTSGSRNVPLAELLHGTASFAPGRKTLLVCATGRRSLAATQELRDRGLSEVYSLRGGVKGIRTRLLT